MIARNARDPRRGVLSLLFAASAASSYGGAMSPARELWMRIETIHAVTYFAEESIAAASEAGLRGFWMGYFGFRAAPLGAASAGVVEATFANFAPSMVRRAVPDAWSFASPDDLVAARAQAAASALRRVAPGVDHLASAVSDRLGEVVECADPIGRALFCANRDVAWPADPVERLWQQCTTLREHRGDGHVVALAAAGLDGCEVHRLVAAGRGIPDPVFLRSRGWTTADWAAAGRRLVDRGVLRPAGGDRDGSGASHRTTAAVGSAPVGSTAPGGASSLDDGDGVGALQITPDGVRLRDEIEERTDRSAIEPFRRALGVDGVDRLLDDLTPVATTIARSGVLPYPNPMALPSIDDPDEDHT